MCYNKLRFFKVRVGVIEASSKRLIAAQWVRAICCQNEKCWVCCDHIILFVAASVHVHVNHNKAACRGRYSDFVSIASRLPGGDKVAQVERFFTSGTLCETTLSQETYSSSVCSGFAPDSLFIESVSKKFRPNVGTCLWHVSTAIANVSSRWKHGQRHVATLWRYRFW